MGPRLVASRAARGVAWAEVENRTAGESSIRRRERADREAG